MVGVDKPTESDDAKAHVGRWIRSRRTELGWTQVRLQDLCGFGRGQLSSYETGEKLPGFDRMVTLRWALLVGHLESALESRARRPDDPTGDGGYRIGDELTVSLGRSICPHLVERVGELLRQLTRAGVRPPADVAVLLEVLPDHPAALRQHRIDRLSRDVTQVLVSLGEYWRPSADDPESDSA